MFSIMLVVFCSVLVYGAFICVEMEFAKDRIKPRNSKGWLRINQNGFVISNLFWDNIALTDEAITRGRKKVPRNSCNLFWGIFFGNFFFLFFHIVVAVAVGISNFVVFLFGFLPNISKKRNLCRPVELVDD